MIAELETLRKKLARLATHYDFLGQWPERSIFELTAAGAWAWVIPEQYGGSGLSSDALLAGYEAVAGGCMSTLLILTQRDAACQFIAGSKNEEIKQALLPRLARTEILVTVGISQLTTSHQTSRPALTATREGDHYRLRGFMPWVTAASKAQYVVTAAAMEGGDQLVALVPTDLPGVIIDPPMQLMALSGTLTTEVHCKDVIIESKYVLGGPSPDALSARYNPVTMLVAASGIGLAGAMTQLIETEAAKLDDGALRELAEDCRARFDAVRERVMITVHETDAPPDPNAKAMARVAVNDLLVRLTVGVLTFAKGSGFLRQRDAQRFVREAMFFMVWAATDEVRIGTLSRFMEAPPPSTKSMALV